MTKKSGNGKKNGTNSSTKPCIPCFCYSCGKKVGSGQKKCINPNCCSHKDGITYASSETEYCVYCESYAGINKETRRCLNCNAKVHGVIASNYKHTYH